MRLLSSLLLVLPLPLVAWTSPREVDALPAPTGQYLEARSAAVYAGACHFGGEYTTNGREALLAWSIASGGYRGVDLSGLEAVLVVVGDQNLCAPLREDLEPSVQRRAVLFLERGASVEQVLALSAWIQEREAALLVAPPALSFSAIDLQRTGDGYQLRVGEQIEVRGALLAERECCKMPYNQWYKPFEPVKHSIVGCSEIFRCTDPRIERRWSRSDENNTFVASF